MYKLHSDGEQCATVGVLKQLFNYRDGIKVIEYFNYDKVTLVIEELSAN